MLLAEGSFTVEVGQDTHHATSVPVVSHTTSIVDVACGVCQDLKYRNYRLINSNCEESFSQYMHENNGAIVSYCLGKH